MDTRNISIAMAQIRVEGGQPEKNLNRAAEAIQKAAAQGAHAILLPECLDLGWTHDSAHPMAQPIPGPHSQQLCTLAHEHHLYIVAGLVERDGDQRYNSAILIDPQGAIRLKHRKSNEIDFARKLYTTQDTLEYVDCDLGRVAIPICADMLMEAHHIGDALGEMGVTLILSPCAWAVPPVRDPVAEPYGEEWITPYTRLTQCYPMTILGVSNVGELETGDWAGWHCIGASLAMGPGAQILTRGPYGKSEESLMLLSIEVP